MLHILIAGTTLYLYPSFSLQNIDLSVFLGCFFFFFPLLQHPRTWEAQFQSGIKVYSIKIHLKKSKISHRFVFIYLLISFKYVADHSPYSS